MALVQGFQGFIELLAPGARKRIERLNECSAFMSDISGKLVKRESVKQLGATPLNSISQGRTWRRPWIDTLHVNKL